jgi:hypothetical protein
LRYKTFKRHHWKTLGVFLKNNESNYSIGFNPYGDKVEITSNVESEFRLGSISSTFKIERIIKPANITIADSLLFEVKDQLKLKNELQLNKSLLGFNFAIYKDSRSFYYQGLPNNGTNLWMSFYLNHSFTKNLIFDISYDKSEAIKYVYDGIIDRLKIKISGDLNLFSEAMALSYVFSLDGYLNRENGYALSPIEKFPIKSTGDKDLQNIWIPSLSIQSTVKNVEIKYEMINILSVIYDLTGTNRSNSPIIFNHFFPSESRLASLSIRWHFSN